MFPWGVSDTELGDLHKHCYTCFNVVRCTDQSCEIVECSLRCGLSYHQCKEPEHILLCGRVWVPCLNVEYGCDIELQRNQIQKHLPRCPANIVTCGQEWNRWPLFCKERFKNVPFKQRNPLAASGDLDLELALRDQRMVGEFIKAPRKTKLALRNNLTRRYPALPLPQQRTPRVKTVLDKSVRTLQDIAKFEVSDLSTLGPQYGVAKLFLKQQEVQKRRWQEDVDNAIQRTGQPIPKRYWEFNELEKGNIHKHCAYCVDANCKKVADFEHDEDTSSCAMVECSFKCGAVYHHCKAFEHRMICEQFVEEGEYDWLLRDRMVKRKKKDKEEKREKPFPDLLEPPTVCPTSRGARPGRAPPPPPPPPPPHSLQRVVRFDIRLETVTRLQQKPRAMFTFICGQEMRRDEWESHSKNVHSDICGGLNNWMVARCPLASFGCGFSFNRLYPGNNPGNRIVFSASSDGFGVRRAAPVMLPAAGGHSGHLSLVDLPTELLLIIFKMLDPWALSQLALTSRYMRAVASTLLDTRGCVALQWERFGDDAFVKLSWKVAYKRWFFSSHFDPIRTWGMNTDGLMANHLKTCPYNDRVEHRTADKKDPKNIKLMKDLLAKLELKRKSDWFIK